MDHYWIPILAACACVIAAYLWWEAMEWLKGRIMKWLEWKRSNCQRDDHVI